MDNNIGVIVGRFQAPYIHEGHMELLEYVCSRHKKVIIFLGSPHVKGSRKNPLDFTTRKYMITSLGFDNIIIDEQMDNRSDYVWSENLDNKIKEHLNDDQTAILYGSRDSFIPRYHGKFKTQEFNGSSPNKNSTEIRETASKNPINTEQFRMGVVYGVYNQYPKCVPTVDVCAIDGNNNILLAKKPGEDKWRFVGGHVDPTDKSLEEAALREFFEETGGGKGVGYVSPKYVCSSIVDDWRYRGIESKIMTTLFLVTILNGESLIPSDDISELGWFNLDEVTTRGWIEENIIEEHVELMKILIKKL